MVTDSSLTQHLSFWTRLGSQRWLTLALLVTQLMLFALMWKRSDPRRSDFPAFYAAARVWRAGGNPYDLSAQCRVESPIVGNDCLAFPHPPVLLPVIALITGDDFLGSYWRWSALLLVMLAACLLPLYFLASNLLSSALSLLFVPVLISLTQGQDTAFVLLSISLWVWLMVLGKDFLAGLALSLAVIKPQLAIVLGLALLFARPKAFLGFCLGGLALTALSFLLVGVDGFRALLKLVGIMAEGRGYGTWQSAMFNAVGILSRFGLTAKWGWPIFVLSIPIIGMIWRKTSAALPAICLGIVVAAFASPHLHAHDLSLLVIPLLAVHPLAAALATLIMLSGFALGFEHFSVYVIMLTLVAIHLRALTSNTAT